MPHALDLPVSTLFCSSTTTFHLKLLLVPTVTSIARALTRRVVVFSERSVLIEPVNTFLASCYFKSSGTAPQFSNMFKLATGLLRDVDYMLLVVLAVQLYVLKTLMARASRTQSGTFVSFCHYLWYLISETFIFSVNFRDVKVEERLWTYLITKVAWRLILLAPLFRLAILRTHHHYFRFRHTATSTCLFRANSEIRNILLRKRNNYLVLVHQALVIILRSQRSTLHGVC